MHRSDLMICAYIQMLIVVCTILLVSFAPPARGTMLLVSTTGLPLAPIFDRAAAAGARPIGMGPLPSSLLVFGDRDRILATTLPAGIIALAAPSALCGSLPE